MGQLMVDQLIVGPTGRTAMGLSLVKPEPHDSSVVLLTYRELYYSQQFNDVHVSSKVKTSILMYITYKYSPPASCCRCLGQCEGPLWFQHTAWASACCKDPIMQKHGEKVIQNLHI